MRELKLRAGEKHIVNVFKKSERPENCDVALKTNGEDLFADASATFEGKQTVGERVKLPAIYKTRQFGKKWSMEERKQVIVRSLCRVTGVSRRLKESGRATHGAS